MNRYSYLIEFARVSKDWDGYMARGFVPSQWFHYREWDGKPYDFRTIAGNEIVLDIDEKVWITARSIAMKIQDALNSEKIPYIMAYSGGFGIHFHIFLNAQNFELVIGWRRIKVYLAKYILNLAGVKPKHVDLSILKKKRQLIRDFGGKKFYFKIPFKEVPLDRPKPKKPSYPNEIGVWKVPVKLLQNIKFAEVPPDKVEIPAVYNLVEGYGIEYPPYEHAKRYYNRILL